MATVVLLSAGGLAGVTVGSAAADVAAPAVADAQWAASEAQASSVAEDYGHAVGVTGETSPTFEVLALPDGQLQSVSDSVPQRVLIDGSWRPVDTKLVTAADGMWSPSAVPSGLELSAGGSDVMARIQAPDGSWAEQLWPDGALPAPTVTGSTATYPSVLPGVDLILGATPSGMSEVFEVHSAQAAANPQLQTLELAVQGATLSQDGVNSTVATMTSGSRIKAQEPLWWDSSAAGAGPTGPGNGEPQPVAHTVAPTQESLDVSAVAQDPDAEYPVFVDPAWSSGDNDHWYDDKAYPNQTYLNGNENASWLGTGAAQQSGLSYLSRAFWQFPTGALAGKTITDAHLAMTETETLSTTDTAGLYLIESPLLTPGATWNQENATANVWAHPQATFTPVLGSNGVDVKGAVAWSAANSQATTQFGLRASDESNLLARKHWALNATLTVTYDSKPNTPTGLAITSPARTCSTSTAVFVNNDAQAITLQANLSDPDSGQNVGGTFTVYSGSTSNVYWTAPVAAAAQGARSIPIPKGTLGNGSYGWFVTASDGTVTSGGSASCLLNVDNDAPAWPAVASAATSFQVGHAAAFAASFAAGDHVKELEYWWGGPVSPGAVTTPVPAASSYASGALPACPSSQGKYNFACASGTTTTLSAAPTDTDAVLWVAAIDQAGNVSAAATGTATGFWRAPADKPIQPDPGMSPTSGHQWITSGGVSSTTTVPDSNTGNEQDLTLGAGLGLTTVPAPGADPNNPLAGEVTAFELPGLVMMHLTNNGSDYATGVENATPSGYHHVSDIGQLAALDETQPANSTELYSCMPTAGGDEVTSTSKTCSGNPDTPTPMGYVWSSPPGGDTTHYKLLKRCYTGTDFYDSVASTCEHGGAVDSNEGYVAEFGTVTSSGQLVDTTKSFTAAAWVYPEQLAGGTVTHTLMSESGPTNSGFYLQQVNGGTAGTNIGGRARMCLRTQTGTVTTTCVVSVTGLPLDKWSLVVGIWDSANHQIRLSVDASLGDATVTPYTSSGDISANGPVLIGSAMGGGSHANQWNGLIVNPVIFPGVIDSAQLYQLDSLEPVS